MKITVVTIVYNDVSHIESTLINVIGQKAFNNIEYIVIDGASTDGTSEIISNYSDKISIYIRESDSGIYNAMNKGLDYATGDYIVFINCGDRLTNSDVISDIMNQIGKRNPDVVYGNYREISDNKKSNIIPCRNSNKIWYGPVASHQSTFYRLAYLRNQGLKYDESYRIAADYKLTAQAIKSAKLILKTDICISDFDIGGVSSLNQNAGLNEANRVRREVFGWSKLKILCLTFVLLAARYSKKYVTPIYNLIRYTKF